MAQTVRTSQFGTKVWDARRVDLPVDGQSTAQANESGCRLVCDLEVRSREHVRRHAISLAKRCCPRCCPTRHPCCPIAESVVRAVHLLGPGSVVAHAACKSWSACAARRATALLQRTRTEPALV